MYCLSLRLQLIDLCDGFPCMLLVVFSILRIWLVRQRCFLVVFCIPYFLFTIKEVLLQNSCISFDTGAFFLQCIPPLNSECMYIIRSTNQTRRESWSGDHVFELCHHHSLQKLALISFYSSCIMQQLSRSFGV